MINCLKICFVQEVVGEPKKTTVKSCIFSAEVMGIKANDITKFSLIKRNTASVSKPTRGTEHSIPVMHEASSQPGFSKSHLDESTHLHWYPWGKSAHSYPTGQGLDAHLPPGLTQPGAENHVVSVHESSDQQMSLPIRAVKNKHSTIQLK